MQTQLSRTETYSNRKKSKKIPMLAAGLLTLSLGAGQVYATVLGTDVISLLKSALGRIQAAAIQQTDTDMLTLGNNFKQKIRELVTDRTKKVTEDVSNHKTKELERAERELNEQLNQISTEVDSVIVQQTPNMKQAVTDEVDAKVEQIKQQMNDELKHQLQGNGNDNVQ